MEFLRFWQGNLSRTAIIPVTPLLLWFHGTRRLRRECVCWVPTVLREHLREQCKNCTRFTSPELYDPKNKHVQQQPPFFDSTSEMITAEYIGSLPGDPYNGTTHVLINNGDYNPEVFYREQSADGKRFVTGIWGTSFSG